MASIFDLKTSTAELASANEGTSRMQYEQHPPTRDITGNNFPNGAIHIRWQTSGQKWWVPSRSYIRMRATLTKPDGTVLQLEDDIAPNMGLMSNLFQSSELRIADKTVSRVSDYMPQVDALETRLSKSKSYLDSFGNSTNWWQDEIKERQIQVSGDASDEQQSVVAVGRAALGFDALNTVAIAVDTGILTVAAGGGAGPPDLTTVFVAGDEIEINTGDANVGIVRYLISAVIDATSLQLNNLKGIAIGVAALDFSRIRASVSKVDETRKLRAFEMTWQPPLSVFKLGHALPSGKYELVLNPQTTSQFRKRAIESLGADKVPTPDAVGGDFQFQVVDMYLYCATVDGPRADDITYLLDLEETRCQVDNVDAGGNFQQKNFDVSPSSFALTTCFQDTRAGNLTQFSASKFKIDGPTQAELTLNRLFLNYAGQNRPAPDADPSFVAGEDYTVQRYSETQLYSGGMYDCGGCETITEWHKRGAYYYFSWPRDGTDRSTRVNVHFGFTGAVANARVLLFDHSKKVARVRVQDGRVVDVQVEDA
jgi:hypothetical protein